jgi:hypothetical protein
MKSYGNTIHTFSSLSSLVPTKNIEDASSDNTKEKGPNVDKHRPQKYEKEDEKFLPSRGSSFMQGLRQLTTDPQLGTGQKATQF